MMMIETTVDLILAAASAAPDRTQADAAIGPLLSTLRRGLETMTFSTPPRITTYMPPMVTAGESRALTAERFGHRVSDLHCAKTYGTPEEIRSVIDNAVDEVRTAALGRHPE